MKFPWSRRRSKSVPADPEYTGWVKDMSLDDQIIATSNVMAVREALNMFLAIIQDHREDGHDCPPYCMPLQLFDFLEAMDSIDLKMMLTVILKDMVDTYLHQQEQT